MLGGFLIFYTARDDIAKHGDRSYAGAKWTCWFTDEAFWMRDDEGMVTGIPWSIMSIDAELPETWAVKYGAHDLLVFRQPLREAGLDEEFQRRVTESSAPEGDSMSHPSSPP